jgi:hypothetical protein
MRASMRVEYSQISYKNSDFDLLAPQKHNFVIHRYKKRDFAMEFWRLVSSDCMRKVTVFVGRIIGGKRRQVLGACAGRHHGCHGGY